MNKKLMTVVVMIIWGLILQLVLKEFVAGTIWEVGALIIAWIPRADGHKPTA